MPRPKLHRDSIELDKEIARIQRESRAEIERLQKARAEAEAAEDRRRGELLREYLAGQHGDDLNLPRFSGHLQRLDRDSRQEVADEETRTEGV